MTNYSRTTLRELKKRYLNILKKCLLANLMAFSFCLPSMAEVTWDENGNGYSIIAGTNENSLDLTNKTYSLFELKDSYNNLTAKLEYAKTNQINMLLINTSHLSTTISNIDIVANNVDNIGTFRGISTVGSQYTIGDELKLIEAKNVDFNLGNFGYESKPTSNILGFSIDRVQFKIQNNVTLNLGNTYVSSIVGVKGNNTAHVIMPNVILNSKNVVSKNSITGIASGWIGSNFATYEKPPYEKFDVKNITLNIEDTIVQTAHIYAINSNLWGNTVGNSNDLVFSVKNININLKNSVIGHSVRAIGSGTGTILGDPNIKIAIDKESVVKADVVGYYGWGWESKDKYLAIGEIGDITLNVDGTVNSIEGIHLFNTEKVNTENIAINLNGATINKNVTGTFFEGTTDKSVETKDFNVNVRGDTVVKGSLQGTNKPTSEILTIGDTTLTVQENSKLTVGSIDKETGEFKGEISAINKISLKENSLLEALINPIQPVVTSIDEETTSINKKLFETNVSMDNNATLRIRNNSNLHTLNSNNGIVDLGQTTSDSTINIQELEGEGTTILTDSTEVAKTTIGSNKSKKLTVAATSKLNDEVNNPEMLANSLAKIVNIQEGEKDLTLAAEEGRIQGQMTAELKDGSVKNLQVKANTVTESVKDVMGLQVLSFRNQINDVQKRMGDLRLDENLRGTWVRTFGGDVKFGDMGLKNKYNTIQAGADFKKGNAYFGIMASLTEGESDMDRGTGEDKTYGLGVYAGYMTDNGWYVDATAKQMHLQNKFKARYNTGELSRGSYKTWGTSVSLEAGKRMNLPCGFFVEPQAEIMYGRVQGINYTTSAGVKVEQEAFESLIGRAGFSVGKTFKDKGSVYANVSLLNDFAGKVKTTFSYWNQETKTRDDMGGAWTEFAVGGTYKLNKNTALYGEFATSKGTDLTNPVQWSLGLRFSF